MGHELCESVRDMSCVSNSASVRVARFMEDGTGRVWQNSLVTLVSVLGKSRPRPLHPNPGRTSPPRAHETLPSEGSAGGPWLRTSHGRGRAAAIGPRRSVHRLVADRPVHGAQANACEADQLARLEQATKAPSAHIKWCSHVAAGCSWTTTRGVLRIVCIAARIKWCPYVAARIEWCSHVATAGCSSTTSRGVLRIVCNTAH